jgi:hypothetical protein
LHEHAVPADAIIENNRSRIGSANAAKAEASSPARASVSGASTTEQQSAMVAARAVVAIEILLGIH